MKIKVMLSYIMSLFAFAVAAQGVEHDDMYFNSKDRAALRATKVSELSYTADAKKPSRKNSENKVEEENVNPTDSYSARTVNPEFAARSNAQSAQTDNQDYFVNDYKYTTTSNFSNWNNNYNRWYNNPWYTSAYFGPNINSWNSPYYGYNDPYYSPWYDPYWNNSGWSASFSYHWGNSWNYGWGGNYNYWNRPYCGWASSWGPGPGYGNGWGSSWYGGYPRTIVIVDRSEGRTPNYGKRPSRSSHVAGSNIESSYNREATRRANSTSVRESNTGGREVTGGRVRESAPTRPAATEQYYDRSWRRTQQSSSSPSYSAPQRSATYDRPSSFGNSSNSNSTYTPRQRAYNQDNSSFSSPSRSSSTPSYNSGSSGGSRSGSSSTSGGGSRRGRD